MKPTHHEKRMRELLRGGFHDSVMEFYRWCISAVGQDLSILDLGAGNGLVASSLTADDNISSIVAYDRDLQSMRGLEEVGKITKRADGSISDLPFPDRTYDVVVCRYAFHHFHAKSDCLGEIHRILKPEGILLYSDPVIPEHSRNVLNPLYAIREDLYFGYLDYYETIALLESSGFTPILVRPYKYHYSQFEKYLEGVEDGFAAASPEPGDKAKVVAILKKKIERAWGMLDAQTRREMEIREDGNTISFSYHVVDISARKSDPKSASGS